MREARILLIEKDEELRAAVISVLERAEYEVIDVGNALEGLKRMYEICPDVVIIADDLPGVNGEDLCSRLRRLCYVPIIVLGSEKSEASLQILDSGADVYLTKDHNYRELVARVRSLLRRKSRSGF